MKRTTRKVTLNRETLRALDLNALEGIAGGFTRDQSCLTDVTCLASCRNSYCC